MFGFLARGGCPSTLGSLSYKKNVRCFIPENVYDMRIVDKFVCLSVSRSLCDERPSSAVRRDNWKRRLSSPRRSFAGGFTTRLSTSFIVVFFFVIFTNKSVAVLTFKQSHFVVCSLEWKDLLVGN